MIILASDTSGKSISVALAESGRLIDEILEKTDMQHASSLLPAINNLLDRNGLRLQDIDLFATTTGPGSFTGIRIGLSTVMGLAYGTGKEIYSISSLAALAASVSSKDKIIAPVLDARGGRVFSGLYQNELSLIEERPREIAGFLEALRKEYPQTDAITFVGDGSPVVRNFMEASGPESPMTSFKNRFLFAPAEKNDISAAVLASLAYAAYIRGDKFLAAHEIEANYGIESAAKRNFKGQDTR